MQSAILCIQINHSLVFSKTNRPVASQLGPSTRPETDTSANDSMQVWNASRDAGTTKGPEADFSKMTFEKINCQLQKILSTVILFDLLSVSEKSANFGVRNFFITFDKFRHK